MRGFGRIVLVATFVAGAALAAAPSTWASTPTPTVAATGATPASTSRFEAIRPTRLADTREADCGCTPVDADTVRVTIAGRNGIPSDIVAAAVTVT
ncbi:MAG: hypothetical protein JWM12_2083, partial [Ilumatobacteraceae bacterium]|nr:hypothetical protein [Ilumatobacteraceae bacterium]